MALNKEVFKTPEDKMRAFRQYREENCRVCKGCRDEGGGQLSAWYVQMCFTAWLESESKDSFTDGFLKLKAHKETEAKNLAKQKSLAEAWSRRYPSISPDYDPELQKPPFEQTDVWPKRFTLDTPLYETYIGDDWYFNTVTAFKFTKREGKLLAALGVKTVRELFGKNVNDLWVAARKCGQGQRMVDKMLALRSECHELAKELGLVPKDEVLEVFPAEMLKTLVPK